MAMVLFVLLICLLFGSVNMHATAPPPQLPPPPAMVKPNCPIRCGKVTIPFPFGIGAGCFLSDWYEIVCLENNTEPWLKKLNLKVLNITLPRTIYDPLIYRCESCLNLYPCHRFFNLYPDQWPCPAYPGDSPPEGTIHVSLPMIGYSHKNCTRNGTSPALAPSLEGSPFFYSHRNALIAVGCKTFAVINSSKPTFLGCRSSCRAAGNLSGYSNCSGTDGCCISKISADQQLDVHFMKKEGEEEECSYAFVANYEDNSALKQQQQKGSIDIHGLISSSYVPGVLEWGIFDDLIQQPYPIPNSINCVTTFNTSSRKQIVECKCRYTTDDNPYLANGCPEAPYYNGEPYYEHRGKLSKIVKYTMIVIGSIIGVVGLLFLSWKLFNFIVKGIQIMRKEMFFKRNGGILLQQELSSPEGAVERSKLFNSNELEKATDNFNKDRILGQGGQGTVYKAMLTDGRIVAVKKSMVIDNGKVEQFINEVLILSQINHRSVVKLLGCCLETEIPLLVYEFIPNGTLYDYLHVPNEELPVSWDTRLRLAKEVVGALSYMHSGASIPIYHRDIKSTNILLDEKYRAKVADFGTSRSVSLDKTHVTTLVQGTFGYLDPEYFQSSQFTDKSDVYSFGVVLVELLTGQKPISSLRIQEGRGLAAYFIIMMEENKLFEILDPQIEMEQNVKEEIETVACLARRCLNLSGRNRPTMKEVATLLEGIRPPNGTQQNNVEEQSGCISSIQPSEISEMDDDMPTSTYSELLVARVSSMSDVNPLLYGQTW